MPTRAEPPQPVQAAISVSEMARRLTLSRQRFYELVKAGVFPGPCYCLHTRRALYPAALQQQCLAIRETNIGANGQYVLFNRPKNDAEGETAGPSRPSRPRRERPSRHSDPMLAQLREGLAALGLTAATDEQIQTALQSAYPTGTAGTDFGVVLASVFRLLRARNLSASRQETA